MQPLPGFRDFFPEEFARRRYLTDRWREAARRFGFQEMDGPTLESLDLYRRKNEAGTEILRQLFDFIDKGDREVALRPEMTPTLVRMIAARERAYRKPIKWFSIAPFFRYEKMQKGRLREFLQLNCDLVGEAGPAADAELIALATECVRCFGFGPEEVEVRISDRRAWQLFAEQNGLPPEQLPPLLEVIDKIGRDPEEVTAERLAPFGVGLDAVRGFIASGGMETQQALREELSARGLEPFVTFDLSIVRGLAYYTGVVFEIFDRKRRFRAIAGGGRYDRLLADLSGGAVDLPAIGFGMGDVVLQNLIESSAQKKRLEAALAADGVVEVYVVIADPSKRPEALGMARELRESGLRTDYPLGDVKVGKQFAAAEAAGARFALVVGAEFPTLRVKKLATREEVPVAKENLVEWIRSAQSDRLS